ncbi:MULTISPECIES: cytochrome P450 [unclassified Novosphingobium]|uniref:cytochrome P450 n=1 Tax=unclassified Novosphingobium TaxID=2644732 RepID=UPI000D40B8CB|nr:MULTISPECIES: cytochrome P450 [unclassified Novosphingobium]PTR12576.1 cytochrome P450 [Novosphingobium sp. GV055]PUB06360.1 cytochrome P450 [Novosphingobium sp. GV061]PUB22411.1 cytochrome P450 [Novosphingobium sp. GV079]PUB44436.1 cytochrome P450 [Novosphingobium sp. GV027]
MIDQQTLLDPHARNSRVGAEAIWAEMRERPGLTYNPEYGGFYYVTRYADVLKVLTNPTLFSSAHGITLPPAKVRSAHVPAEVDPPAHAEYRNLLVPLMTPARVRLMEDQVRNWVTKLLDAFQGEEKVEFFRAFARSLPVHVALDFLGLPQEDGLILEPLVDELHEEVATGVRTGAADRLTQYARSIVESRKDVVTDPDADVVSSVLLGKKFGEPLTVDEQISMFRLFLVGGFDTASMALAAAVWWLAQHPEDFERLREHPELIDSMSEDAVRFSSPATYLRREVTQDIELGGTQLQAGDQVLVCFGAANRDPAKFSEPDRILLDRKPNVHVGFGAGNHRCVGSFIAKLEMRLALEEMLKRYKHIALDESQPVLYSHGLNQGIVSLPLLLVPA